MSKTFVSVEEVKNALKIDSFRNLSKDKIMEFVTLIPNMDKEVAIKIIEQYPAFAKLSESMVAQLNKMCDTALEKNEESQRLTIQAYKQILDELSNQLHMEDISKEEREKITKQMIEIAYKISVKDTENKAFIDKMVKYSTGFAIGALVLGAAILGVNIKGKDIPKLL
ncbi:hypothetical protein B9N51_06580 [Finegoldia magna]|uniref:hypothetical protein n=1 Tax=Finegoldia magna TaxID=1260 RepID=UPI000B919131|nr:hypothetical protein [Finegoldia magna]OXZ27845.1 hypothetical protein B9N51_06580 [Finegoldia magna]